MDKINIAALHKTLGEIREGTTNPAHVAALQQAENVLATLYRFKGKPVNLSQKATNITQSHKDMFDIVREHPSVALFSCFVDGQPSSALAAVQPNEAGGFDIMPMFVTINDYMMITDHDGATPGPVRQS